MLANQVWTLTQTEEQLYCTVYRGDKGWVGRPTPEELKTVYQYFQLDVSLAQLYHHWSSVDPHFQEVAQKFQGEFSVGVLVIWLNYSFTIYKMGIISTL